VKGGLQKELRKIAERIYGGRLMTRENQTIEWKKSWRDEYLRRISGFANCQGGVLVIGRNDRGEPVGVVNGSKLLEDLPNKIRDLLGIMVNVNLVEEAGVELLEIHVPAYTNPISFRGRYYTRSGSTLQELKGAALDRFLLQRQGRTWDSVPLPGVKPSDLSLTSLKRFRELTAASGRLSAADLSASDSGLLEKLKLAEGKYLKRAAVLLFHEDPDRFITGAFVKIGYFVSEADLAYHDEIHGSLFSQAHAVVDLLRTKYMKAAISYQGIQRIEQFPVPYEALREAVVNALVHRDYAVPAPIQIRVYEHKLRIWNPAVLPDGRDLEKLLGAHASHPYNPDVANAFFRSGEIESWGRGIEKIFSACRKADSPPPGIHLDGYDLWVEFQFSQEYLAAVKGKGVLDDKEESSGKSSGKSSEKILDLLTNDSLLTIPELAEKLQISTRAVEKNLHKLQKAGRLKRIGPTRGGHWEVRK
jgi:ATP-dependent DNA helicase RecG